jgi:hypothetical protein
MNRIAIVFFSTSMLVSAQNFQPPSWAQPAQGHGSGQGQGTGQGAGQGQGSIQQQINQLQSQIEKLRAQQREQQRQISQPYVEMQTGPVTGHPISGKETRRTTQTLMDGTEVNRDEVSYFYRNSAGAMRAEGPNSVLIFNLVDHMRYRLDPAKKTYTHSTLNDDINYISMAAFGHSTDWDSYGGSSHPPAQKEGITEDLGKQMVNGVMAKGSRVTITIPAGIIGNNHDIKVVNERWYSDDLQVLIKSTNTDPRFGVNVYELTDIKQTEPDISLFKPPSDYLLTTGSH